MHRQLELLIMLHDLDLMIKEIEEVKDLEEMGFRIEHKEEVMEARNELIAELDDEYVRDYNIIFKRFGRAVVPVNKSICYGCFMRQPTQLLTRAGKNDEVRKCEHCGRFIYWLS